jgi:hypothetical protein
MAESDMTLTLSGITNTANNSVFLPKLPLYFYEKSKKTPVASGRKKIQRQK